MCFLYLTNHQDLHGKGMSGVQTALCVVPLPGKYWDAGYKARNRAPSNGKNGRRCRDGARAPPRRDLSLRNEPLPVE